MSTPEHSVESARDAAERGDLASWVHDFLASPGSDNAALGEQLAGDDDLVWDGPMRLPFDQLHRLAGPPDTPSLGRFDEEGREAAAEMAESFEDGWRPPPLIVQYRDGQLVVEDGTHRIEGLRRAGEESWWAVVCFADDAARKAFTPPGVPTG